jgi:hypothetical protein
MIVASRHEASTNRPSGGSGNETNVEFIAIFLRRRVFGKQVFVER